MLNVYIMVSFCLVASPEPGFAPARGDLSVALRAYWQGSLNEARSRLERLVIDPALSKNDLEIAQGYLAASELALHEADLACRTLHEATLVNNAFHLERSLAIAKPDVQSLYEKCGPDTPQPPPPVIGASAPLVAAQGQSRSNPRRTPIFVATASAGVFLVTGVATEIIAGRMNAQAASSITAAEANAHLKTAEEFHSVADATLVVAAASGIVAIVLHLTGEATDTKVSVTPMRAGMGLTWCGSFP